MSVDKIKENRKEEIKQKKVEVFSTPTCPYCTKIKNWLENEGIKFVEYDVSQNKEKAKEMVQMSGRRGVPQTRIGEQVVIGFQPEKIKEALD